MLSAMSFCTMRSRFVQRILQSFCCVQNIKKFVWMHHFFSLSDQIAGVQSLNPPGSGIKYFCAKK